MRLFTFLNTFHSNKYEYILYQSIGRDLYYGITHNTFTIEKTNSSATYPQLLEINKQIKNLRHKLP